jgi:hypothetical protein
MWGSGCIDPRILNFSTSWRWVASFTPWVLYLLGKSPVVHWIGGWVGPRTGVDDVEKRKILPLPGLELWQLGRPTRSQLLYRLFYGYNGCISLTQLTCCRCKQDKDGFFCLQTLHPETVEVTKKVMESQSGATQPFCGSCHTVPSDEDDHLTQEAGGGTMGYDSYPIVELDGSGSVKCREEMETAELPVLPPACVSVLLYGSETKWTVSFLVVNCHSNRSTLILCML